MLPSFQVSVVEVCDRVVGFGLGELVADVVGELVTDCFRRQAHLVLVDLRSCEGVGVPVRLDVVDGVLLRQRLSVVENAVEVNGTMEDGTPKTHKRRTLVFPKLLVPALAKG